MLMYNQRIRILASSYKQQYWEQHHYNQTKNSSYAAGIAYILLNVRSVCYSDALKDRAIRPTAFI